jgi:predicted  nucleic acid-binding Zn-ribbon protein
MAWYRNHYDCYRCGEGWDDEWSCMCDDDCPNCGARHCSPTESEDLTEITLQEGDDLVLLVSPDSAGHDPCYREIARFRWAPDARP